MPKSACASKILLVHQNFPGQFPHIATGLVARGHDVRSLGMSQGTVAGLTSYCYSPTRSSTAHIHPWIVDFETQIIRAEAALGAAFEIAATGFEPDLILAHHGWGESLFLKEVWPNAKLVIYCEYFYQVVGADVGFDPEFDIPEPGVAGRIRLKNLMNELHFPAADAGLSPTQWQKSLFPESFRSQIKVIHEGVDTQALQPNPLAQVTLNATSEHPITLRHGDEVITFVNRNLEPYRGYHQFMRALPQILRARPHAQVLIIGGDGHSYGAPAPDGKSWRDVFLDEVRSHLDLSRVHFLGQVPHETFVQVLQVSAVHVYLSYPFVLSWSLIEAMSIGCAVVACNTDPVKEVIEHNTNGLLIDFFQPDALAKSVIDLLADPVERARLASAARKTIQYQFDLQTQCLPKQLEWLEGLLPTREK